MDKASVPLYVAIINYNGAEDSIMCLTSLAESSFQSFRPLIVDNDSRDDSASKIRRVFPHVEILRMARNLGYAGGCNAALQTAVARDASYCLVLNNDTVVDPHALGHLVETAERQGRIAAVGPRVMDYANRDVVLSLGGEVDFRTGWGMHTGRGKTDGGEFNRVREINGFLDGSAIMFILRSLHSIGVFDERYFMYHEESDWCYRARRAGFRLLLNENAVIWHKGRGTAKITDPKVQYLTQRNRVMFLKKFASRGQWVEFWLRVLLDSNRGFRPSSKKRRTTRGGAHSACHVIRGLVDGLFGGDTYYDQYRFE